MIRPSYSSHGLAIGCPMKPQHIGDVLLGALSWTPGLWRRIATTSGVVLALAGAAVAVAPATADAAGPCGPPVVNPVACENTLPGNPSTQWDVSGSGDASIQGFATDISVNKGGTISFKISTAASAYTIGIFRFGYYQGNGARKIASVSPSARLPQTQPACLKDVPTGLVDCGNWGVSASWTVPTTAVSGVYEAELVRSDTSGSSQILFVVRDDSSHSDVLFQTDDTTWQAYNDYGGNSLYYGTAPSSDGRAYKVSYNRPFHDRSEAAGYGTSNFFFYAEYPMIRFLEANGYDISYASGVDADRSGLLIKNHRVLLTAGHDEYWSGGMRSNVEAARDAGVNMAFFTGNEVFWKTRFENSIDGSGTSYRTFVCYKETKEATPIDPKDPPTWTGTWRDPTWSPPADGGRPENALNGTIFMVNRGSAAITVPAAYAKLRLWRNTSVATLGAGQTATLGSQTLGYEWDEDLDNGFRPTGLFDLSSTTVSVPELLQDYGNTYSAGTAVHHLTMYRAGSGALVFGAGTVQWAWGLDVNHDTLPDFGPTAPDPRMQQATVNLLADMGVQPATIIAGMVPATPSTDTVAPTSAVVTPASGSSVSPGSSVTITGTGSDAGGGVVAGVEVSVDGGATWHPAAGTTSWSYVWKPLRSGSVTIRSRAVDDSGNLETPGAGSMVSVSGSTSQPQFIAKSTVTNGKTVAVPAGVVQGDVLVAILEVDADPVTVTGPSGWVLAKDTPVASGGGSNFHIQVWYKVAGPGEQGSYAWVVPGNPWVDIGVIDYAYVNTTSPIDAIAGRDAGTTGAPTTPAITTTQPNDLVIAGFVNYYSVSFTAGSGMTQRYNYDGNTAQDAVQAVAGGTGSKTANSSGTGPIGAVIVALKPLSADMTPPTVAITAPANGATVSGAVTLSATATDNVGVASVQFRVDGADVGAKMTTAPYNLSWNSATLANGSHSITAVAADAAGNQTAATPITVTVNNVPPVITNVQAGGLTTSGATISWSTDVAASSQVEYGTSTAYGSSTSLDSTLVTSHSQVLGGLAPATTYHFRVKSANAGGSLATSGDFTFTTATPAPPVIANVQSSGLSSSGATITWSTDTASDTTVRYGTTSSYGASASTAGLVTSHTQALSGLAASTTYHYQVQSKDAYGQTATSADFVFTTTAATSPPTFRSASSVTNGLTVAKPAGVVAGDLLLATLEVDADPVTVTGPGGWTLLIDTPAAQGTGAAYHAQVWYKVAGASEPASFSWSVPSGIWVDIGLLAYTGVNSSNPIDAYSGRYGGTVSTATTDSVTTSQSNELVIALFINYNYSTFTAGTAMTKRYDFDGNSAEDAPQAAAGSTGARSMTASASGPMTAQIITVRGR
jgi:N,N-dimethylformamidase beta subunit-like, C-terminal/Bacterial Ig domain/Purple acid Phosphatase, N-terminal domain